MNLRVLLEEEAAELRGTETSNGPDGMVTWSRTGRPFATASADGSVAGFALDPAVAEAAARTPDVTPSERGAGWVTLTPAELDEHAADRAVAWLVSAHRRAEPPN